MPAKNSGRARAAGLLPIDGLYRHEVHARTVGDELE